MRQTLEYTEGYWWRRKSDNLCFRNAILADWDSLDNYEQITDAEKEALDDFELTDAQALDIITKGYETE